MEGSMGMISSNTAASALHRKQGEAVMVAPQPREDAGARIFKTKQARPAANIIAAGEPKPRPQQVEALKCPRCDSTNTKFCYYNNHSTTQPRYFCKACRRYWTQGGALRNVPVGGGSRKNKKTRALLGSGGAGGTSSAASSASSSSSNNSKINLTQLMMTTMPAALTAAPATDFPNVLPTTFMSGGGGGGFELPTAMDIDHQVPGLPFTPLLPATSNNGGGSGGAQPLFMDMLGGGSFFNSSTTNTFGINLPFPLAPFGAMPPMRGHGMDASSNNHHAVAATQLGGHLQGADQEVKPMAGGGGVQWSPSSQHGNINDGGFAE